MDWFFKFYFGGVCLYLFIFGVFFCLLLFMYIYASLSATVGD